MALWGSASGTLKSLPARGVRVEMMAGEKNFENRLSHSPQGECGLKYGPAERVHRRRGHSPQGECGLKFPHGGGRHPPVASLPARGVRVEIRRCLP